MKDPLELPTTQEKQSPPPAYLPDTAEHDETASATAHLPVNSAWLTAFDDLPEGFDIHLGIYARF